MKLFLISQTVNKEYDTISAAVVCAPDEKTALNMDPDSGEPMDWGRPDYLHQYWCDSPIHVTVKYLGEADDRIKLGIVCVDFRAG